MLSAYGFAGEGDRFQQQLKVALGARIPPLATASNIVTHPVHIRIFSGWFVVLIGAYRHETRTVKELADEDVALELAAYPPVSSLLWNAG
jgi:hypothetical protein